MAFQIINHLNTVQLFAFLIAVVVLQVNFRQYFDQMIEKKSAFNWTPLSVLLDFVLRISLHISNYTEFNFFVIDFFIAFSPFFLIWWLAFKCLIIFFNCLLATSLSAFFSLTKVLIFSFKVAFSFSR